MQVLKKSCFQMKVVLLIIYKWYPFKRECKNKLNKWWIVICFGDKKNQHKESLVEPIEQNQPNVR